jgi:hypothetical protein
MTQPAILRSLLFVCLVAANSASAVAAPPAPPLVARPAAPLVALLAAQPRVEPDTVRGVVFDSLANEPLAGAFVVGNAAGNSVGASAATDSLGQFVLVSEETITQLTAYHPALDAMGLGAVSAFRPARTDRWHAAYVATPSLTTLWPKVCGSGKPDPQRTGIITGTARLADNSTRVSGARVLVQWQSVFSDSRSVRELDVVTDSVGNYVLCGVEEFAEPRMVALSAQAQSGAIALPSQVRPLRRVDLVLSPNDAPRVPLRGRVRNEQGAGVEGVRITLDGVDGEWVTSREGTFSVTDAPLGTRMLSLRAVGYSPVSQVVEVLGGIMPLLEIPLERTVELEGVRVTERVDIRRVRSDFESRRRAGWARFVDSTAIDKAPFVRAALNMVQGITVRPRGNAPTTEFEILGRNGCQAHLYMDGTISDTEEVNRIPKEQIAAIEIYPSVAFAPAQLIRVRADNCAVAAFWTKLGLRP